MFCPNCSAPWTPSKRTQTCDACGKTVFRNPPPVAVLVVPVVDNGVSGYLAIHRQDKPLEDDLAFPGGFVDFDETWEEAAVREVEEEVGLVIPASSVRYLTSTASPTGALLMFGIVSTVYELPLFPADLREVRGLALVTTESKLCFSTHQDVLSSLRQFKMQDF